MKPHDLDLADLLPHAGAMILLERILDVGDDALVAEVVVRNDRIYSNAEGAVPISVGVEYMAQAIAALAGVRSTRSGGKVRPGLLLGVRGYSAPFSHFIAKDRLIVRVESVMETRNGLGVFDCEITRGDDKISARLTVISVDAIDAL